VTRAQLITALLLVTVICLGLSALLLPPAADRAPTPVALVAFPPSQVVSVSVALPGGSVQRLDRIAPDAWRLTLPAGGGETHWPASAERVRAFLRILDRLRGTPADDAEPVARPGPTLTVTSDLGDTTTIELPAGSLGGRALVRVSPGSPDDPAPRAFVTTDELSRLLGPDGVLPWLDARAFAGLDGQVGSVTVNSVGGTMTIARTGGSWRLEAPFAAPAEGSLLAELIESLQTLAIASPSTEVQPPSADATTITMTTAARAANPDGSVSTATATHTLRTLGAVSQSGQAPVVLESTAEDGTPLAGPIGATIDAARLAEIVRRPSFYIARRATNAGPADVRSLTVTTPGGTPIELTRADAGWTRDGAPLPAQEASAIDALVSLLTQTAAAQAEPAESMPETAQPLATITARGLGGLAIAEFTLGVAPLPGQPADSRAHALLLAGGIARYYNPESAVDAVRWVAGVTP
jgi:hypothetical protein